MRQPAWMLMVALALATSALADAPTETPAATQPAAEAARPDVARRLAEAERLMAERGPALEKAIKEITAQLAESEPKEGVPLSPEVVKHRQTLTATRTALQNELTFLQSMLRARQAAVDARESARQATAELKQFEERQSRQPATFGPAERKAFEAQIDQSRSILSTIEQADQGRQERLQRIGEELQKQDLPPEARRLLQAERQSLIAQIDSARESRESHQAAIRLLEAKLGVPEGDAGPAPTTQTSSATSPGDANEAENKQKLAEFLEREAHGEQEEAKRRLQIIRDDLEMAIQAENHAQVLRLEDEREYWQRKLQYEERRLRQADMEKRVAVEKRNLGQIATEIQNLRDGLTQLQEEVGKFSPEERQKQAERHRTRAQELREQADTIQQRADGSAPGDDLWQNLMKGIDTLQESLRERVEKQVNFSHYHRMITLLDAERQQVNALLNISEVIVFAQLRQATLLRQLADLHIQAANILVPPEPSFFERHKKIVNSILIVLSAFLIGAAIKGVVVIVQKLARAIGRSRAFVGRFSPKRVETLINFTSSIVRVFMWIFAVILVLAEFDIDPARTTGVIGVFGLLLAGMFQQLVIDFVKGLDILTGRHYNVGDFVELDGKTGHVIDFTVKHTRIRTPSGQEYNLPNSKCIPSRRFPEGYVDNYIDITLRSTGDVQRAKRALTPVCRNIARRIEQVKEEPEFVDRIPGTRPGTIILRYRIRVLPACDWVVKEQLIPDMKAVLAEEGIELVEEPRFFFINRIQTFRHLFSRELSEAEILAEAKEQERPTADRPAIPSDTIKPAVPADADGRQKTLVN